MRMTLVLVMAVLSAVALGACASSGDSVVAESIPSERIDVAEFLRANPKLGGRWASTNPSFGGLLEVEISAVNGRRVEGTVFFGSSACPWKTPFKAVAEGREVSLAAELGGACGKVKIDLQLRAGKLSGWYEAGFPDSGQAWLSPTG